MNSGIFNTTVIEADMDGNLITSGDLPFWLRDIIERAFSTSGIRLPRKVALRDAIASLESVDASELADNDACPICYDDFVMDPNKKHKGAKGESEVSPPEIDEVLRKYHVRVASMAQQSRFKDPLLFVALDCGAQDPIRFPQKNLYSRETASERDMLPNLEAHRTAPTVDSSRFTHLPVRMPHCGHVFGKTCIVEWLNRSVSCPLCRKEVEALSESDPDLVKLATIRRNCNFVVTDLPDEMAQHLARNSTNVFNPARRPFNPFVTPLLMTSVRQSWATPAYPRELAPEVLKVPDPDLIMARKFPLSYLTPDSAPRQPPVRRDRRTQRGTDM